MKGERAKEKQSQCLIRVITRSLLGDLVAGVSARAAVDGILDVVMERCIWRLRINEVWGLLEHSQELQEVVRKKMWRQEKEMVDLVESVEKEERLERKTVAQVHWRERQDARVMVKLEDMMECLTVCCQRAEMEQDDRMDWSQTEIDEHRFMEDLRKELGLVSLKDDTMVMELDPEEEHEYLDRLMEGLMVKDDHGMRNVRVAGVDHEWKLLLCQDGQEFDEEVDDKLEVEPIEICTEGYKKMGTWYRNNWYIFGGLSTSNHTPAVERRCGENLVKKSSHVIPTIPIGVNLTKTNIVGVKGTAGGSKRRAAEHSGGWSRWSSDGPWSSTRLPWRCGQRRLQNKDKDAQVTKDNVPEFREDDTPAEENCEEVALLKDVQGNMVRLE